MVELYVGEGMAEADATIIVNAFSKCECCAPPAAGCAAKAERAFVRACLLPNHPQPRGSPRLRPAHARAQTRRSSST